MKKIPTKTPQLAAKEAHQLQGFIHDAICKFSGPAADLESALGMFMLGRYLGWRALYIIHSKKTVAKYERTLGIDVHLAFDEFGPDVDRSAGMRDDQTKRDFWKVVSGEIRVDRNCRKWID